MITNQTGYDQGYRCDRCQKVHQKVDHLFFHCYQCHFDLCPECAECVEKATRCPEGHVLYLFTHHMLKHELPSYQEGYVCNACMYSVTSPSPSSLLFW